LQHDEETKRDRESKLVNKGPKKKKKSLAGPTDNGAKLGETLG
jgi:hypothetical protein